MSTVNSDIKSGRPYEGGSYMTSHMKQDSLSRLIYNLLILITEVPRNVSLSRCQSYNVYMQWISSFISIHRVSQQKRPAFAKFLIPQYQSNDAEDCLVLSPICQIRFSNLPGFNRSSILVEKGDFLQNVPFENLQKRVKTASKISLCSPY